MPVRIDKLTPKQIARFEEWSRQWIDIGLSTEPADFDKAIEAALRGYAYANLKKPMIVLRMSSPYGAVLGGALAWSMLRGLQSKGVRAQVRAKVRVQVGDQVRDQVGAQVRDQVWAQVRAQVGAQVWDQVGDQVGDQVWDQVGAQVWDQVRDQVGAQVWAQVRAQVRDQVRAQVRVQVGDQVGAKVRVQVGDQVRDQVGAQVRDQVWAQVRAQVGAQVWDQVRDQVRVQVGAQVWDQFRDTVYNSLYAQHDAGFGAWVTFFRDVCGWTNPALEKFEVTEALIKSCGWTWWHENVLAISDRPSVLHRDENNRLHCETGPAIAYRDGWSIYYWHGVSVPAEWIEKRATLDPAEVLKSENVEQRAAGAAIIGWPKMVSRLKRKVIDGDPDTDMGALIELTLPGLREPGRFLQAICVRNGTIVEGIPRVSDIDGKPIETALAAQAWRVGLTQTEYRHPVHRT